MKRKVRCEKCGKEFKFLDFDAMDVPLYLLGANGYSVCEKCEFKKGVPKKRYIEKFEYLLHNLTSNNCFFERLSWDWSIQYRNKIWGLLIKWGEIVGAKEIRKIKEWVLICPNRNKKMVGKFITGI